MPGIDDDILNCAVYFYGSLEAAKAGEQSGGCGFLLGVPSDAESRFRAETNPPGSGVSMP
jgi:hypothetical protein